MLGRLRNPYRALEKALGYGFKKRALLELALTHRSYRFEHEGIDGDNQRLEFLGDAALGLVSAAFLYKHNVGWDEGRLTSFRSKITSGRALAETARDLGLGEHLRMGKGEEKSGGRRRDSNLYDALEAVLGAAFLDGGYKAVEKVFKKLFVPRLDLLSEDVWEGNPKGKLQEYCQRTWRSGPQYRVLGKHGPAHSSVFAVEVVAGNGAVQIEGRGHSKQEAETDAALKALRHLGVPTGSGIFARL